ncbi:MAG: hypothetical protein IKX33_09695 [Prevotella sp.]|nr:hypothetical protein [Prevotella sp.]
MTYFDEEPHSQPFSVPEGYFDKLTERVMAQIPEDEQIQTRKTRNIRRLFPYAAAASVLAAAIGIGIYLKFSDSQPPVQKQTQEVQFAQNNTEQTIEEVADYIMYDDNDLYAYIAGE